MSSRKSKKNRNVGSLWGRLRDSLPFGDRRALGERKPRSLRIDTLEERTLLSVSAVNVQDMLINQVTSTDQYMSAAKAVATDNNGDFVVTWTRYDDVFNTDGTIATDPATGLAMTDANIYARYFTAAVQRITLPAGTTSFALQYGGNEIQKISISAGTLPYSATQEAIQGTFDLSFGGVSATVNFDETLDPTKNAAEIQTALRSIGAEALSDVVVSAIDAENYYVKFGDASQGQAQQLLTVENTSLSGFLPIVTVGVERTPGQTVAIPVSSTTPATTAANIEYAFSQTSESITTAPVIFPFYDTVIHESPLGTNGPYNIAPTTIRTTLPGVTVKAISATEFELTFTGTTAFDQQPLLTVLDTTQIDSTTNLYLPMTGASAKIVKESSDEFRVNDAEPDDPETLRLDVYDQTNSQVAMTPDGDFIITWQSVVPDSENYGSVSDIYARRFSPAGYVADPADATFVADMTRVVNGEIVPGPDGVPETHIESVVPLGDQFLVNTQTANAQADPSVGVDMSGNFTIAWDSKGQGYSFFNLISAQRFDASGNRLGTEFVVNTTDDSTISFSPCVAMSRDGLIAIGWTNTNDPNYGIGWNGYWSGAEAKLYTAQGAVFISQFFAGNGGLDSIAFDAGDNFVIVRDYIGDSDNIGGGKSEGVFAEKYQGYDASGGASGQLILSTVRANSASLNAGSLTNWPYDQWYGQGMMDADGDLTISFDGYGPDASEPDVDATIESILAAAAAAGSTDSEIAALRQYWESYYGLLRGEADGALFSQFDSDSRLATTTITSSDSIANNNRDGENSVYYIDLNPKAVSGGIILRLTVPGTDAANLTIDVPVTPVFYPNNGGVNVEETRKAIHSALTSAANVGLGWTESVNNVKFYEGSILVTTASVSSVTGTVWDPGYYGINDSYIVYQVTFLGSIHDTQITLAMAPVDSANTLVDKDSKPITAPHIVQEYFGYSGTMQYDVSGAMTADGDFVLTWNEDAVANDRIYSNTNLYYRVFNDTTDTAGPIVTRLSAADGTRLDANSQASQVTMANGLQHIVVTFDQQMYDNLTHTGDAVTNKDNFVLLANGVAVDGAIVSVQYGLNKAAELYASDPTTYADFASYQAANRWEAVITIDGNGTQAGTPALASGVYTLEALTPQAVTDSDAKGHSGLRDLAGNALGRTGYTPSGENSTIDFTLVIAGGGGGGGTGGGGAVFTVDQSTSYTQTTSSTAGNTTGKQYNSRVVAMDNSGDFAVVWISYGQDGDPDSTLPDGSVNPNFDSTAATSAGVYMRLYDRNNTPLTGETLVNTFTIGNQTTPSVAMDADGDFVVVWASQGQDGDGSWGIYGQRFNSVGEKVGAEFQINTQYTNDQVAPSVSMDDYGNFIVAWATQGQSFSYFNDIHAQKYDTDGQRVGGEVRINSANIPGVGTTPSANEIHPSIAMSDTGSFVVTWDAAVSQVNGIVTNSVVMARLFDANENPVTINGSNVEFRVNVGDKDFVADYQHLADHRLDATDGGALDSKYDVARNAQVSMDASGNFIIAWEAFQDNDIVTSEDVPESYGIYYRHFKADGTALTDYDLQANLTVTANATSPDPVYTVQQSALYSGDQLNASIAMDANGDFIISWDGNGSESTDPLDPTNLNNVTNRDSQAVWVRDFHAAVTGTGSTINTEAVTAETRVNTVQPGYQGFASVDMTRSGSGIVVWMGNGTGDSQGIYARRYNAATDTAGPLLTDFLLPDGSSVAASGQVSQSLQAIVLTFDEDMLDNADHSGHAVTNPNNYQLLYNGVAVSGGISKVYYGLDIANSLGSQYGLSMPKTNKYQAVLIVDANGASSGVMPLTNGQYQVVALNNLQDKAGNALASTGTGSGGSPESAIITISLPTGQETKVAAGTTPTGVSYGKYTYATTADSVASDASGNYVVVWTDTTPGHQGVWAKMYQQTSTVNSNGVRTTTTAELSVINPTTGQAWVNNEILISSATNASDISVARNSTGDFVVTWSAFSDSTNWDVYARRFNALGQPQGDSFRVNSSLNVSTSGSVSYLNEVQQYSSVAMDANGDFVITWQSNAQDGSGYGVYAQAFNASGDRVGGNDEIQAINFASGFTGTFALRWDDDDNSTTADKVTSAITYTGNASAVVAGVKSALEAIGAKVNVVANGLNEVLVQFIDEDGSQNLQTLWVASSDIKATTSGGVGTQVSVKTYVDGKSGEFQVNNTTAGSQIQPDVAMDANGDFVITWTSYGQGNDAAGESNIYAKKYTSSSFDWTGDADATASLSLTAMAKASSVNPKICTVDNPNDHIVAAGTGYDGVVQVIGNDYGEDFSGSGSLLAGTNWILTAAHIAWSSKLAAPLTSDLLQVAFDTTTGRIYVPVTQVVVNPGYNGDAEAGSDVALLKLAFVPAGVEGFAIYTGTDEVGKTYTIVGYGDNGTGTVGAINSDDYKRKGENIFDAIGTTIGATVTQLVADFDDGTAQHDAFGVLYGIHNTDTALVAANQEAVSCHGDSGGPELIDGKIAGVVSYGYGVPGVDIDNNDDDSTYGEFDVYARVSSFASWIENITDVQGQSEILVNKNDVFNYDYDSTGKIITDSLGNSVYVALDNESGNQGHSSVAMDSDGDFVITWTSAGHDGSGTSGDRDTSVFARRYNANATEASDVFRVNQTTEGDQQNSRVSMDAAGDFIITWESDQNGTFDIYARRYAETYCTMYTTLGSLDSTSSMPFLIVGRDSLYTSDPLFITAVVTTSSGVTAQTLSTGSLTVNNGAIGGEFLVNSTKNGDQNCPGVALDATGDAVIVWSGNGEVAGQTDPQGVFFQRFARGLDFVGASIGPLLNVVSDNGSDGLVLVRGSETLSNNPTQFVVAFSEAVSTRNGASGINSILNPTNWQLTRNGSTLAGAIVRIEYGLNEAYILGLASAPSGKYEAVITFDGDLAKSGNQGLVAGQYVLTIKSTVQDLFGNGLNGAYGGLPDAVADFARSFFVASSGESDDITDPGTPDTTDTTDTTTSSYHVGTNGGNPDVAMDANGDYVVVWQSNRYGDGGDIDVQRYDSHGQALGAEFTVNAHTKTINNDVTVYAPNGVQTDGAVAMDAYGDFVVVWAGKGDDDDAGVYAQVFDKNGDAVGDAFLVNQFAQYTQNHPDVAMDDNGDFVVTWSSYGQTGDLNGVYARRFTVQGQALGDEFRVNTTTANLQDYTSVAIASDGSFVVAWQSYDQDGDMWGIDAQRFSSSGAKVGSELQVNTFTKGEQVSPSVAMDSSGDFVVAWQSFNQDGSGYGVYARRYSSAAKAKDASEFLVSQTTLNWQISPSVGMASDGSFVITWQSFGQDNIATTNANPTKDQGVYARMFNADGTGTSLGEFRINAVTLGDQTSPAIAVNGSGSSVVAWMGPNNTGIDVFSRVMRKSAASIVVSNQSFSLTGPTAASYALGSSVTIAWTAGGVVSGSKISLCYDSDTAFNNNEKWIEIDKVVAADGSATYTWNTTGLAAGTYYIGGYMYDGSGTFTTSHLTSAITLTSAGVQGFALNGPTSGSYAAGSTVTITGTASNVVSGSKISLCYDTDTTFNGNEKWIEIDGITAANGTVVYTWDTTGMKAGAYYIAGYMYDGHNTFTTSHLNSAIAITGAAGQSFTLNGPNSGSYAAGDTVTITGTAANVVAGSKISLCYDTDTTFNGNEKWIEIDGITAANGTVVYTWDTTGMKAGAYYIAGYMYDWNGTFTTSHLTSAITVTGGAAQSFALTGPTSGSYAAGDIVTITGTASNVVAGSKISLCYDTDATFNGNEKWIEIDGITAANGTVVYTWNTTGLRAGTYYIAGYMYDWNGTFTTSHLNSAITVTNSTDQAFALSTPTSGSYSAGSLITIGWTASNVVLGSKISLCYDTDTTFNGNEKWIEIDAALAANGSASYVWNTTGLKAGVYYIAGYMYDWNGTFTTSHLNQAITITSSSNSTRSSYKMSQRLSATSAVFAELGEEQESSTSDSAKAEWLYDA